MAVRRKGCTYHIAGGRFIDRADAGRGRIAARILSWRGPVLAGVSVAAGAGRAGPTVHSWAFWPASTSGQRKRLARAASLEVKGECMSRWRDIAVAGGLDRDAGIGKEGSA